MPFSNRNVLTLAAFLACAAPSLAQTQHSALNTQHSSPRPNVLLILADDLGYNDVSFNGRKEWQTPALDKLASEGILFRRWYTAAVVCAPSRAALLTGRHTIHCGVTGNASLDLPSEEVTIAEALKNSGYATGLFGKWHHGQPRPGRKTYTHPMDQGFDEFFGYTNATKAWQKFPKQLFDGREEKPVPPDASSAKDGYADTLFTDRAIAFIEKNKDKPFFAYVPFVCSHGVVEAPEGEIKRHEPTFKDRGKMARGDATYAAECTRMDKDVARLLKTLDDHNLRDNTIVIFTSDHGATFEKLSEFVPVDLDSNAPFRGHKRTLWEGGVRVPAIVRWPARIPAGQVSTAPTHSCDVFPTLMAATGVPSDPATKIDGANLLPVWEKKSPMPQRDLFWEWDEGGATYYAAMRGNLKLLISGTNKPELFDVESDPAERIDRSQQHPQVTKDLKSNLDAWLATTTDAAKLKNKRAEAAGREKAENLKPNASQD